jgi:hypothetical protein
MASSRGGQRRIRICTCVLLTYTSITTMQSDCTWMTSLRQDAYAGLLPMRKVQQQAILDSFGSAIEMKGVYFKVLC